MNCGISLTVQDTQMQPAILPIMRMHLHVGTAYSAEQGSDPQIWPTMAATPELRQPQTLTVDGTGGAHSRVI